MTTAGAVLDGHDHDDGTMLDGCERCEVIANRSCNWCGFGHVFTTHNPLAHYENGDPIAERIGEDAWFDTFNAYEPYDEGNRR